MRFKKLTAGIVAASLALSTLAQSAIAGGITFSDDQWWTVVDSGGHRCPLIVTICLKVITLLTFRQ